MRSFSRKARKHNLEDNLKNAAKGIRTPPDRWHEVPAGGCPVAGEGTMGERGHDACRYARAFR